jgi:isoleucyl-tRNA synthetase
LRDSAAFYFDTAAAYCDAPDDIRRRRCGLCSIAASLSVRWLAPSSASRQRRPGSPVTCAREDHLELFPDVPADWRDETLGERWGVLRDLRRVVTGALELERGGKRLGSSLQAEVELFVPERFGALLRGVDLAELCITSAGTIRPGPVPDDAFTLPDVAEVGARVSPALGDRCERCWRVLPEVGQTPAHIDLCHRCAAVLTRASAG